MVGNKIAGECHLLFNISILVQASFTGLSACLDMHSSYNQIDNFSIITYVGVLRRTEYPITGAQYVLGLLEMSENDLIRL